MIDKNSICFTKLKTVKSINFEYTYEDFFDKMIKQISLNIARNKVLYDANNNCYQIIYNGDRYNVLYGSEKLNKDCDNTDIIRLLDKLVEFTIKQEQKKTDEEKALMELENKKLSYAERREQVIKNAEKGIFKSDEDKKIYIDYLKSQMLNVTDTSQISEYFEDILDLGEDIYDFFDDHYIFFSIVGFIGVLVPGFLTTVFLSEIIGVFLFFAGLFIDFIVDPVMLLDSDFGLRDMELNVAGRVNSFILTTLITAFVKTLQIPFVLGRSIADIVDNIRSNHNTKKKIKLLKKSLSKNIVKRKTSGRINNQEVEAYVEIDKTQETSNEKMNNNEQSKGIDIIIKEFANLKDRIMIITDKAKQKEYAMELKEIISYYKDLSKSYNTDSLKLYNKIIDQITSLLFRVNETIKEEEQEKKNDEEYNDLMNEISKIEHQDEMGKKSKGSK